MTNIFTDGCGTHLLALRQITIKHHLLTATSLTVRVVEVIFLYNHILFSFWNTFSKKKYMAVWFSCS